MNHESIQPRFSWWIGQRRYLVLIMIIYLQPCKHRFTMGPNFFKIHGPWARLKFNSSLASLHLWNSKNSPKSAKMRGTTVSDIQQIGFWKSTIREITPIMALRGTTWPFFPLSKPRLFRPGRVLVFFLPCFAGGEWKTKAQRYQETFALQNHGWFRHLLKRDKNKNNVFVFQYVFMFRNFCTWRNKVCLLNSVDPQNCICGQKSGQQLGCNRGKWSFRDRDEPASWETFRHPNSFIQKQPLTQGYKECCVSTHRERNILAPPKLVTNGIPFFLSRASHSISRASNNFWVCSVSPEAVSFRRMWTTQLLKAKSLLWGPVFPNVKGFFPKRGTKMLAIFIHPKHNPKVPPNQGPIPSHITAP